MGFKKCKDHRGHKMSDDQNLTESRAGLVGGEKRLRRKACPQRWTNWPVATPRSGP